MRWADLVVMVVIVVCVLAGCRAGAGGVIGSFVGGVLFWGGTVFALRHILPHLPADRPGWRFIIGNVGLLLMVLIGAAVGRAVVGGRGEPPSSGSAVVGGALVLVLVGLVGWELAPVAGRPGNLHNLLEDSATASLLADVPPPPIDVDRVITSDLLPISLTQLLGEPVLRPPPTSGPAIPADRMLRAEAATVQFAHTGCGGGTSRGTGFSIGNGMIVTNAHVVEGSGATLAVIKDTRTVTGHVRAIDHARDLAVVSAADLDLPALPLADSEATRDDLVWTLGHPDGQAELDVGEAQVEQVRPLVLQLEGRDPTNDRMYVLATDDIRPGSSGGPVVDGNGEVVAIIEGGPPDDQPDTYALAIATAELRPLLGLVGTADVEAGPCPKR